MSKSRVDSLVALLDVQLVPLMPPLVASPDQNASVSCTAFVSDTAVSQGVAGVNADLVRRLVETPSDS